MTYQIAGSVAGVAYFPTESELSRRFKHAIGAVIRRWEELCTLLKQ